MNFGMKSLQIRMQTFLQQDFDTTNYLNKSHHCTADLPTNPGVSGESLERLLRLSLPKPFLKVGLHRVAVWPSSRVPSTRPVATRPNTECRVVANECKKELLIHTRILHFLK